MLGCSPGTLASGIPLSGLLPSGGLMSGALPAMQPAAPAGKLSVNSSLFCQISDFYKLLVTIVVPAGGPFGLNNSPGLRPLNLLQVKEVL